MSLAGLSNFSYFSRGQSVLSPKDIVVSGKEKGYTSLALADINTLAGIPTFTEQANKYNIKAIPGITVNWSLSTFEKDNYAYIPITILSTSKNSYNSLIDLSNKAPSGNGFYDIDALKNISLNGTNAVIGVNSFYIIQLLENNSLTDIYSGIIELLTKCGADPYIAVDLFIYENFLDAFKSSTKNLSASLIFSNTVRFCDKSNFLSFKCMNQAFESDILAKDIITYNEEQFKMLKNSYMPSSGQVNDFDVLFKEYITGSDLVSESCKTGFSLRNLYNPAINKESKEDTAFYIYDKTITYCKSNDILYSHSDKLLKHDMMRELEPYCKPQTIYTEPGKTGDIVKSFDDGHPNLSLLSGLSYSTIASSETFNIVMKGHQIEDERIQDLYTLYSEGKLESDDSAKLSLTEEESTALRSYDLIKDCVRSFVPDILCFYPISKDVYKNIPLKKFGDNRIYTEYYLESLEKSDKIRLRLIELPNFRIIRALNEQHSANISIDKLNYEDTNTYNLIKDGLCVFVFYLNRLVKNNKHALKYINNVWDIASLICTYRVNNQDLFNLFMRSKEQASSLHYFNDSINKVLAISNGIILYREQVYYLLESFGNIKPADASLLIESVNSGESGALENFKQRFVTYSSENNILMGDTASKLFDDIVTSIKKGINNLSHTLTLTSLVYLFAYTKANHLLDYYETALNNNLRNHELLQSLIEEARQAGIELVPVNINKSEKGFTTEGNSIVMGFSVLKDIDEEIIDDILRLRKETKDIKDMFRFCIGINSKYLSKNLLEDLICAGAFDYTGNKRSAMFQSVSEAIKKTKKSKEEKTSSQFSLFGNTKDSEEVVIDTIKIDNSIDEWDVGTILRNERETCGFYITEHPITKFLPYAYQKGYGRIYHALQRSDENVTLIGLITRIEDREKKTGGKWCKILVEDIDDSIEVLLFSRSYAKIRSKIQENKVYVLKGKITADENKKIFLNDVVALNPNMIDKANQKKVQHSDKRSPTNETTNSSNTYQKSDNQSVEAEKYAVFNIQIKEIPVDVSILMKLKEFLEKYKGDLTVYFVITSPDPQQTTRIKTDVRVSGNSVFQYKLLQEFSDLVKRVWCE